MNHFIINRFFSNRQFGFVKGRSTTLQLLQVIVTECLEQGRQIDVIYTDLLIISIWNGLPDTVISATTVDTFKARLDRFWQNQEVIVRYGNSLRICVLCCDLVADRTSLLIDSFEICRLALSADVTDVNFRLSAAHGFVGTTVHWKREMFEFIDPLSFRRSKSMTIWP